MNKNKSYSALFIVSTITIIILLVQVFIFYFIFWNANIGDIIENSSNNYYDNKIVEAVNAINDHYGAAYDKPVEDFTDYLLKKYEDATRQDIVFSIDKFVVDRMLGVLNDTRASQCFLLLNSDIYNASKDDIFVVRDESPQYIKRDYDDIKVEIGKFKIVNELGLNRSRSWVPQIDQNKNVKIIAGVPILGIKRNSNKAHDIDRGYWESGATSEFAMSSLRYVKPICVKNEDKIIGYLVISSYVNNIKNSIGIKNFEDGLYKKSTGVNTYFSILTKNEDNEQFNDTEPNTIKLDDINSDNILFINNKASSLFPKEMENKKDVSNVERIDYLKNNKVKVFSRIINMHNSENGQKHFLLLFVGDRAINYGSDKYNKFLTLATIVTFFTAIILSFLIAKIVTAPITLLVKEIDRIDDTNEIVFKRTNVKEIDLLKNKIENLTIDIINAHSRMQNLLEIVGFPIVILEEDVKNNTIYRTGRISVLLGELNSDEKDVEFYTRHRFIHRLRKYISGYKIKRVPIEQFDETSRIIQVEKDDKISYIRYDFQKIEDRRFHVYTEYTEDYEEILSLEYEKNYDELTGLLSRTYFKKLVSSALETQNIKKAAMVMWDLDNLKFINDTYGHDWGDSYLKETARGIGILKGGGNYISRFAGDEFFAFLPYDGDKSQVRARIKEVQDLLFSRKLQIGNLESVRIRASVGICWYPEDGENYDELYKFADFAMYRAKHSNKGSINEFEKDIYLNEYIVLSGKEELNRLIEKQAIKFAFQPIVDTKTGEVFGYETLMRTSSTILATVKEVMKVAKVQFKLPQIERITFEGVFNAIDGKENILEDKKIFINSIANVVLPEISESGIKKKLQKYGKNIVIEITESEEINKNSIEIKQAYRNEFSCKMAIDDFGAGYSTEKSLLKINPDFIKIDMNIIRDVQNDKNRYQLVRNLINYSKDNNTKTIAEGIENEGELNCLLQLGVDYVQGFYLGKPEFEPIDISQDIKSKIKNFKGNAACSI